MFWQAKKIIPKLLDRVDTDGLSYGKINNRFYSYELTNKSIEVLNFRYKISLMYNISNDLSSSFAEAGDHSRRWWLTVVMVLKHGLPVYCGLLSK